MSWQTPESLDSESLNRELHVLDLTDREIEVMWHRCQGKSKKEIADLLVPLRGRSDEADVISEKTVGTHITNAYSKLKELEGLDPWPKKRKFEEIYRPIILDLIRSADDIGRWNAFRESQKERIRNILIRRSEIPEIYIPPPEPVVVVPPQSQRRGERRGILTIVILGSVAAFIGFCIFSIWFLNTLVRNGRQGERADVVPTNSTSSDSIQFESESTPTQTPTQVPTPTVFMPGGFDDKIEEGWSSEWSEFGDELFVSEGTLKSRSETFIYLGNDQWEDYLFNIIVHVDRFDVTNQLAVRVIDPQNMFLLSVDNHGCSWSVIENGNVSRIPGSEREYETENDIYLYTIGVSKNRLLFSSYPGIGCEVEIPDTYLEKFSSGGLGIFLVPDMSVDTVWAE